MTFTTSGTVADADPTISCASRPSTSGRPGASASSRPSIAIVGCGYWGSKHVRVFSTMANVGRVIVVDHSPERLKGISAAFPNVETTTSLAEALPQVDGVVVATPPLYHAAVALQAIRAGRHVLVEKPLTTTSADGRLLIEEARRHHVRLMTGHTFEFNPAVRELRRRMDEGELGTIYYIDSARLNLGLYRSDVDVVWDLAPHDISIMNFLLRATPSTVSAWGSSHACGATKDLAYMRFQYAERGVVGYAHVSWLDPRKVRRVTVVGSKKMAVYNDLAEERLRIFDCGVDGAAPDDLGKVAQFERPVSYRYGDIVSPNIHFEEPLGIQDRHFVDCVRTDAQPISDGSNGLSVVSVLEAIDRSMATGQVIQLAQQQAEPALATTSH
ncbi:MAG: Gfo/Idh/MocA family oxidoreductase [Geminicoccaceae bacterium]